MKQLNPKNIENQYLHKLMLGGIAPRPIAFASTIDEQGRPNLAPFSFYNAFGVNPSTLIFSPSRRGRDNSTKDTYENLKKIPEVVLNVVTYNMVQQTSLSSTDYEAGVNEFMKSGLTPVKSVMIKPFRVRESPLQFECKVRDIIETGGKAGSANLVICEIVYIHIDKEILDEDGLINQDKIDLVGRMGRDHYVRASGAALFEVPKPHVRKGIGVDQLPDNIRFSKYLSGNDLGQLGNVDRLPDEAEISKFKDNIDITELIGKNEVTIHSYARRLIAENKVEEALKLLMSF